MKTIFYVESATYQSLEAATAHANSIGDIVTADQVTNAEFRAIASDFADYEAK